MVDQLKSGGAKAKFSNERVLSEKEVDNLFQPSDDRVVKNKKQQEEDKQREVQVPSVLLKRFLESAWPHSPNEFMAWITGSIEKHPKTKKEISYAQGLYIPEQEGSNWNVKETTSSDGTGLTSFLEQTGTTVVGWIHTHPTFEAYFSSIDCHMQYDLQKDLPMCYGIVIDKDKNPRCLRLSAAGMDAVANCPNRAEDCHLHEISNEEAVVDVPFYVHYSGKRNKLLMEDEHAWQLAKMVARWEPAGCANWEEGSEEQSDECKEDNE
eukprot:Skav212028  [mRNA]  locus=scaffold6518:7622:18069:+ [translate_table: standard]